jgi:hypothetical protein
MRRLDRELNRRYRWAEHIPAQHHDDLSVTGPFTEGQGGSGDPPILLGRNSCPGWLTLSVPGPAPLHSRRNRLIRAASFDGRGRPSLHFASSTRRAVCRGCYGINAEYRRQSAQWAKAFCTSSSTWDKT